MITADQKEIICREYFLNRKALREIATKFLERPKSKTPQQMSLWDSCLKISVRDSNCFSIPADILPSACRSVVQRCIDSNQILLSYCSVVSGFV